MNRDWSSMGCAGLSDSQNSTVPANLTPHPTRQSMQHVYNTMVSSKLNKVTDESSLQMSVLPSPTSCAHHQSNILREKLPIINLSSSEK
uniref:Uncharacterized protein n=1 Tax=Anguilla anguilla TaxID=7936 RepID=A0A0E9X118_ANGAN